MDGHNSWGPPGNAAQWSAQQAAWPSQAAPYPAYPPQMSGAYYAQPPQPQFTQNQAVYPAPQTSQHVHTTPMPRRLTISKSSVTSAETGQIICTISRPSKMSSLSLSEKPPIVLTRPETQAVVGTIRTHSFMSHNVDLSINGRRTVIKNDGLSDKHWPFSSTMSPSGSFFWSIEGKGHGSSSSYKGPLVLRDAKKDGNVIARLADDVLTLEMPGINQALFDEVMVSAVGMAEATAQARKEEQQALKMILHAAVDG